MKKIIKSIKLRVISFLATYIRRINSPQKYKTLDFLCQYLGCDVELNEKAEALRDIVITQVCTMSSWYFPKNCICLIYRNPVYKANDNDYKLYASQAIKRGAAVLISDKSYDDYPCIVSNNPFETYARLCRYYRDLSHVSVTVVSGSIGKTTVKNMIGEVYKMKYKLSYTSSNLNTKTVIGFAAQHIPNWAERLLQEIHEGEPNETKYSSEILHPSLFVITPIDKSHYVYFGDEEKIVEEVCSITEYMTKDGAIIVNIDEFSRFDLLKGKKVITISMSNREADFYSENVTVDIDGLSFWVIEKRTRMSNKIVLKNIFALHNVSCALYAYAVGVHEGITPNDIVVGLSHFRPSGVRQNVLKTKDNVLVYADCYNAVGRSMKSAIETASNIPIKGKRIAVIGDVEECGEVSEEMHMEILNYANSSKFDVLYTIGEKMRKALGAIILRDSLENKHFQNIDSLAFELKHIVCSGDLVLFKASHASNLGECIVKVWPDLVKDVEENSGEANNWELNSLLY